MRVIRWAIVAAIFVTALAVSGVALGVGPWPGLAASVVSSHGDVSYRASRSGSSTIVRARTLGADRGVVATATFDGHWGIPAVTSTGLGGGLSPDGRLLVLTEPPNYNGLRSESTFLLVSTATLALRDTIVLKGEFGFDTLSADGRTLYLIQHRSQADLVSYVVRGYDLVQKRLLPGVIVAKGESSSMRGYPVSRATGQAGSWVYTLYHRGSGSPFIHALNTDQRYAICIDLPWQASSQAVWTARLALSPDGRRLLVRSDHAVVARVDTKTFRVS
jgi:hypothetical protein